MVQPSVFFVSSVCLFLRLRLPFIVIVQKLNSGLATKCLALCSPGDMVI